MHCFSLLEIFVVQLQKNNKLEILKHRKLIGVFHLKEQSRQCFTSGQIIYENKNFGTNSDGCATFFLEIDYRRINTQEKDQDHPKLWDIFQLWISYHPWLGGYLG